MGKLPKHLLKKIDELHSILGKRRFFVYGGAAVDLLKNKNAKVNDFDIAIEETDKKQIDALRSRLRAQGFRITMPLRKYWINITHPVLLIYAERADMKLDVAFLSSVSEIGQFDADSVYWRFPQRDYRDRFRARLAVARKRFKLVRGIAEEDPLLLLARLIYLCAKYNVSFSRNDQLFVAIQKKIKTYRSRSLFHRLEGPRSIFSALFKSLLIAKNRTFFLKQLMRLDSIQKLFPAFCAAGQRLLKNKLLRCAFLLAAQKQQLIQCFYSAASAAEKKEFRHNTLLLKKRKWDASTRNLYLK